METKKKRVSRPKSEMNNSRLNCFIMIKKALDENSSASTTKIARLHNVSQHPITMLRKSGVIVKIGVGREKWIGDFPSMKMVETINELLDRYSAELKERKKNGTFTRKSPKHQHIMPNKIEQPTFDWDVPEQIKMREASEKIKLEIPLKKVISNVDEIETSNIHNWEKKIEIDKSKIEKSNVLIKNDELFDQKRPDEPIHFEKLEKSMMIGFVVCFIVFLVILSICAIWLTYSLI